MTKVTISDKAQAVAAIYQELANIEQEQLLIAQDQHDLIVRQTNLSTKSAILYNSLKVLLPC